jgi:hypothetical protein
MTHRFRPGVRFRVKTSGHWVPRAARILGDPSPKRLHRPSWRGLRSSSRPPLLGIHPRKGRKRPRHPFPLRLCPRPHRRMTSRATWTFAHARASVFSWPSEWELPRLSPSSGSHSPEAKLPRSQCLLRRRRPWARLRVSPFRLQFPSPTSRPHRRPRPSPRRHPRADRRALRMRRTSSPPPSYPDPRRTTHPPRHWSRHPRPGVQSSPPALRLCQRKRAIRGLRSDRSIRCSASKVGAKPVKLRLPFVAGALLVSRVAFTQPSDEHRRALDPRIRMQSTRLTRPGGGR